MAPSHFDRLTRFYAAAPVNAYYAPRLTIGDGVAELVIGVRPEFHHALGAVHGSVYFKALDDAAFFAAQSRVEDVWLLTASFALDFLRPVAAGELRATGRLVHASRRRFIAEALLTDGRGRALGRGAGTFMHSSIPLPSENERG